MTNLNESPLYIIRGLLISPKRKHRKEYMYFNPNSATYWVANAEDGETSETMSWSARRMEALRRNPPTHILDIEVCEIKTTITKIDIESEILRYERNQAMLKLTKREIEVLGL